jgi:LysR family transcriptional regulator, glycine cleavage system transcriptional activator
MEALPSLPALRVFAVAGRTLSFTRAAQVLNVTQAAVSHQIRVLEGQIGAPLFQRTTRSLSLTAAGQQLLPAAIAAFEQIERAVASVRRSQSQLTITTTAAFGARWLAPRLPRFAERHPGIEISVRHTEAVLDLAAEGIDVAIRGGRGKWPGLTAELIGSSATVAVTSPDYCARLALETPADVARAALLHDHLREDWRDWLVSARLDPALARGGRVFDDENVLIETALAGQGVALIVLSLIETQLREGRLVTLFEEQATHGYGYFLTYPPGALALPKIAAFRRFILAEARAATPG